PRKDCPEWRQHSGVARLPRPLVEELQRHLRERLPPYMVPRTFLAIDQLPLSANGKVDRSSLPAPEAERVGQKSALEARGAFIGAHLCQIWQEVLELGSARPDDSFFDVGGDSLLAARLVIRIEEVLGRRIRLDTLLRSPTLRQLEAALFGSSGDEPRSTMVPIKPRGSRLPFFCVHGILGEVLSFRSLAR